MIDVNKVKEVLAKHGFSKSRVFLDSYEIERDDELLVLTLVHSSSEGMDKGLEHGSLRGEIRRENDECEAMVDIPFVVETAEELDALLRVTNPGWWKTPSEEGLI